MSTLKKRRGYTALPNEVIADTSLSSDARFLLLYITSHADGWCLNKRNVAAAAGWGREKLQKVMKELRDAGKLELRPVHGNDGKITEHKWHCDVLGTPDQGTGFQDGGEKPASGSAPPHKNNIPKDNISSTKEEHPGDFEETENDLFNAQSQTEPKAEPSPAEKPDRFQEFWALWPTGTNKGKKDARTAWEQIVAGTKKGIPKTDPQVIIDGMRAYREDPTKQGHWVNPAEMQYIKHPTSWLNGARWEDYDGQTSKAELTPERLATFEDMRRRYNERDIEFFYSNGEITPAGREARTFLLAFKAEMGIET